MIRLRLVAAAVLLFVPAMARAQPQDSAPPPATVDLRASTISIRATSWDEEDSAYATAFLEALTW